jgi:putative tryptophan/tyrosine transport system substrate-binding protein
MLLQNLCCRRREALSTATGLGPDRPPQLSEVARRAASSTAGGQTWCPAFDQHRPRQTVPRQLHPVLAALKQATRTIPIVFFIVNDPAGQGFVDSLGRPGGNITGFSFVEFPMLGKWLEMLKEIAPSVKRTALVFNPQTAPYYPAFLRDFKVAPATLPAELSATPVRDEAEIEPAVSAFAREPDGGLIVAPDPFMSTHRAIVIALAARHRLPASYGLRNFVRDGGLISYGPDTLDIVRRSASYVDRVLRGERPGELPVQSPTKYELLINLKTARALGLTVPVTLRVRANEVIE